MPIPSPHSDEDRDDFIGRCMADDDMQEYDQDQRAAICYDAWRERSATLDNMKGFNMTTINDKKHELLRKRAEIVAKMRAAIAKDDDVPEDEAASAFTALEEMLAAVDARLTRVEAAMAAEAALATDQPGNGNGDDDGDDDDEDKAMRGSSNQGGFRYRPGKVHAAAQRSPSYKPKDERGIRFARTVLGLAYRTYNKASWEETAQWVENRFGDAIVARALNAGITGEGGALIPQDFLADLIELLRANTVIRGSDPMTVGMPMGNLTIPRLAGGAT